MLGSHLHVGYDQLGNLIISLSMAALLWALLRHTRFGRSTRAVVDNPDLSDMIGLHGDHVRRVAWILSTVFAALVGILISPSQGLDVNELVLVVIYAFAPAVLGRLVSLPWAYTGGILLGVGGQPPVEVRQLGNGVQRRGGAALLGAVRVADRHGLPAQRGRRHLETPVDSTSATSRDPSPGAAGEMSAIARPAWAPVDWSSPRWSRWPCPDPA